MQYDLYPKAAYPCTIGDLTRRRLSKIDDIVQMTFFQYLFQWKLMTFS